MSDVIDFPRTRVSAHSTGEAELRFQIRALLASVVDAYHRQPDGAATLLAIAKIDEAVALMRAHWGLQTGGANVQPL